MGWLPEAKVLSDQYGEQGQHPSRLLHRDMWQSQVDNGLTQDSYWVWVAQQLEFQAEGGIS